MMDTFELNGAWWLPENPEDKLYGVLRYERGAIVLDLLGQFGAKDKTIKNHEPGDFQPPIMCGQSSGKLITLCDLILTKINIQGGMVEDRSSSFIAGCLVVGWAFATKSELRFLYSDTRFVDFEDWVGQRPFVDVGPVNNSPGGYALSYSHPSNIQTTVRQINSELSIVSVYSLNWGISERNIVHRNILRIKPGIPRELDWFLKSISTFRNLLTFLNCEQVNQEAIELCLEETLVGQSERPVMVRVFFEQMGDVSLKSFRKYKTALFSFESIRDRFEAVVALWYEKAEELGAVHELLLGAMYNSKLYLRFQFLSLMQAIESYDRIQNNSVYLTEEEYESIRSTLVSAIPQCVANDHRDSLRNRIKFGFEASMRKRMATIFKSLSEASVGLVTDDPKAFIIRVVDTRNYYTHYGDNSKKQAIDDEGKLFEVTHRLKILLYILLLKELGLEEVSIVRAISAFPKLNYINDR